MDKKIGKLYYEKNYSYKQGRQKLFLNIHAQSDQLYSYYPRVKRYCFKTYCIEQLVTVYNNINITIHSIQLKKYRMEFFFNHKFENGTCFFLMMNIRLNYLFIDILMKVNYSYE